MINAALVAMEFNSMLPAADTPRNTEDYEGFFHLCSMKGDVSQAELQYIVRDHDAASFEIRQQTLTHITEILNEKWGEGTVTLTITQQYHNMKEIIDTCPWLISLAEEACHSCDVTPLILPIRGGTDGAQLSFMGLPCPNLGTGGHAYHGPYEHITAEGMDAAVNITLEIIRLFSQKKV
jgi:tripeptide aminopeptidase